MTTVAQALLRPAVPACFYRDYYGPNDRSPALRDGLELVGAEKRVRKLWLEAAEHALATYPTSFATLKLSNILRNDYVMTDLQAKGYTVQAPD